MGYTLDLEGDFASLLSRGDEIIRPPDPSKVKNMHDYRKIAGGVLPLLYILETVLYHILIEFGVGFENFPKYL